MSWDELEKLGETSDIREVTQQREDLARLCLRVLGSEDGQKLLEWLRQMYVDVPVAVPGTDASHAYFAEGQRTVVRDLMARISQARSL
jgi:hypothetical protein